MNVQKRPVFGYINPLPGRPCFCAPIFGDKHKLYYQVIGTGGRIERFHRIDVPLHLVERTTVSGSFEPGDLALYAFYLTEGEVYVKKRDELATILLEKVDLFDTTPFLQLEIGEFLGDVSVIRKATTRARAIIGARKQGGRSRSRTARHLRRFLGSMRPRNFYEAPKGPRTPRELDIAVRRLMDDFFKECNSFETPKFLDELYIDVPANATAKEMLIDAQRRYAEAFRSPMHGRNTNPYVMTGRTGAGKSSLLAYLRDKSELCKGAGERNALVVFVDCLSFRGFTETVRAMLDALIRNCREEPSILRTLARDGWGPLPKPARVCDMSRAKLLSTLRGLLQSLHEPSSGDPAEAVPVTFVLDNVDRMAGFKQKSDLVQFAVKEAKSKGFPFSTITLRPETKHAIDEVSNDIAALGDQEIHAPPVPDILKRRLDVALSERVLQQSDNWSSCVRVGIPMGNVRLEFEDLRRSLKRAIRTLAMQEGRYPAVVPAMSGTNLRNALTLTRAVLKSVDTSGFLLLSKGIAGEHHLISSLMQEEYGHYSEGTSKIRNVFFCERTGYYFARMYILRALEYLQQDAGDFIGFATWESLVLQYGITRKVFEDCAWGMIVGNFALVEVEGTDDVLPNQRFKDVKDLRKDEAAVKLSPPGLYYLRWLIYDIAYLQNVLQDTPVDYELARSLGQRQASLTIAFEQTDRFIAFLEEREVQEREEWGVDPEVPLMTPQVKCRLMAQKASLLKDSVRPRKEKYT